MTFSQHAAQTKQSQLYYLALFSISLPAFAVFMFGWFIPTYELSFLFKLFTAVALLGNITAAIIPETKGKKVPIHRYAAFLASDCLVPLLIMIIFSSHFSNVARVIAGISVMYQIISISILLPKGGYHPKVLYFQATYIAVFHVSILAATFIK